MNIWGEQPIVKSELLIKLRNIILQSKRPRFPKWRFKIDDMSLNLQGMAETRRRGRYVYTNLYMFEGALSTPIPYDRTDENAALLHFGIRTNEGGDWIIKVTGSGSYWLTIASPAYFNASPEDKRTAKLKSDQVLALLQGRMLAVFNDRRLDNLRPDMMLQDNCLICGRGLSDPESRRRWIGPECSTKYQIGGLAPWRFDTGLQEHYPEFVF